MGEVCYQGECHASHDDGPWQDSTGGPSIELCFSNACSQQLYQIILCTVDGSFSMSDFIMLNFKIPKIRLSNEKVHYHVI